MMIENSYNAIESAIRDYAVNCGLSVDEDRMHDAIMSVNREGEFVEIDLDDLDRKFDIYSF